MHNLEWAVLLAGALGQLTNFLARDVVTRTLSFVTGFAEVSVAPAKPLRDRAAELALELDKVHTMSAAIGITQPE